MSRSIIYLRRLLFGVSCTIVFGLGATQALAAPDPEPYPGKVCPFDPDYPFQPYYSDFCTQCCPQMVGYCGAEGECHCGTF